MTAKQTLNSLYSPDGSWYGTVTDGAGNLVTTTTSSGSTKQQKGNRAPDGSIYLTLTDGNNNLT